MRNCHSQEGPKETRRLNVVWNPGQDPGTEKKNEVKTKEI